MNIEEKFLKIISKAEANGFSFRDNAEIDQIKFIGLGRFQMNLTIQENELENKTTFVFNVTEVFFNHNFAKTFFGTHEICSNCQHTLKGIDWKNNSCSNCKSNLSEHQPLEAWQHHLQQLVLEKDLMEYLLKFV